ARRTPQSPGAAALQIRPNPKKAKAARTWPPLFPLERTRKGPQPGLLRMRGPPLAPQAFAKYRLHPPCIVLTLKADEEVVTIANQGRLALKPRLHFGLKPQVEHIMQVDVPQQR